MGDAAVNNPHRIWIGASEQQTGKTGVDLLSGWTVPQICQRLRLRGSCFEHLGLGTRDFQTADPTKNKGMYQE